MMQTTKSLLETTLNTRELGGYRTKDGGYTPCHKLIRSDAPKKLSEKDMAFLLDRQITTVTDMRGEADVRKMPNPIRDNPQFLQLFKEKYKNPENYLRSIGVLPEETGLLKSKLASLNKVK